ncbi:SemiSWEET transporter [Parvularcula dongshanensis]|uniref:MtN3 and saliva related transmembrane protein n=1 Tax=Parvularcula dongshanensis TaxID=1173995 RepID=A0A840HZA5_9PROT|nr:MtN3 and saliva related transmembrane protein [Parvularcula dongshanensis]
MGIASVLGLLAAFLTTSSFLPQALLVLRTRNTAGISLTMYAMFTSGVAFWLIYGWLIGSWPVVIANAATLALASVVLVLKAQAVWRTHAAVRKERASDTMLN